MPNGAQRTAMRVSLLTAVRLPTTPCRDQLGALPLHGRRGLECKAKKKEFLSSPMSLRRAVSCLSVTQPGFLSRPFGLTGAT
jgi:hypothetical protein